MTAEARDGRTRRFGPWRREVRSFLELFALSGVALAQPALDLLSKNAGLFVTLRTSTFETVGLALILVIVPPLALWTVEVLVGFVVPRARRYAHAVIASGLVALLGVEVLKHQTDLVPRVLVLVGVLAGVIGGLLIWRFEVVRLWLRFLAIAPVIFVVLFLFSSPVTAVVFEQGTASAPGLTAGKPQHIVMVVMDEFPLGSILDGTGHVDAELFPNFAALAASSTWFRNATTVAPYTNEAVPAILTGNYPADPYKPAITAKYPRNLFTLLGGTYRMNVHEHYTRLCPEEICPDTGPASTEYDRFTELLDATYSLWSEFASPQHNVAGLSAGQGERDFDALRTGSDFVRSIRSTSSRQLDFLHVLLPHQPWHLRATGQDDGQLSEPPGMYQGLIWKTAWSAMSGRERHLLQVQAADRLIGDVIAKLKRVGAYEDSLIVVTADHGAAFTARSSSRTVTDQNYPEILWVPMFIRSPGQTEGVVEDHPVKTIDVLPTIVDLIDAKLPWNVDGRSMLRPGPVRQPRLFHADLNTIKPPPGSSFITLPGGPGFAAAMRARAAVDGPAALRIYQTGEYGGLVGRPAAPLVSAGSRADAGTLDDPDRFEHVAPEAESIPWTWVQGHLSTAVNVPVAITVNGVIAGVSVASPANAPGSDFWATLPPQLFRPGRNTIGVYLISGTPATPKLAPVRLQ